MGFYSLILALFFALVPAHAIIPETVNLIAYLNSSTIQSRVPAASPASDFNSTNFFGTAKIEIEFTDENSAVVSFSLQIANTNTLKDIGIFRGIANSAGNGQALINITTKLNTLTLTNSGVLNATFTANATEVIYLDALYAEPTNYFLEVAFEQDGIRGQFQDNQLDYSPDGIPPVPSSNILQAELVPDTSNLTFTPTNQYNAFVELYFTLLTDETYILDFFLTTHSLVTSAEIYATANEKTFFSFDDYIRFPSLSANYVYRGQIPNASQTLGLTLLSSPEDYSFKLQGSYKNFTGNFTGPIVTLDSLTPPPPPPYVTPSPPAAVDTGAPTALPNVSNSFLTCSPYWTFSIFSLFLSLLVPLALRSASD